MNIVGHGIDLVDIAEMRRWIEDQRDPLTPRCFVPEELDEVGGQGDSGRVERLAGKFAAGAAHGRRCNSSCRTRDNCMATEHQPYRCNGVGKCDRYRMYITRNRQQSLLS